MSNINFKNIQSVNITSENINTTNLTAPFELIAAQILTFIRFLLYIPTALGLRHGLRIR